MGTVDAIPRLTLDSREPEPKASEAVQAPSTAHASTLQTRWAPRQTPSVSVNATTHSLERYGESIGFSSAVAARVARLRPDAIIDNERIDPSQEILRRAFVVHRGVHNVSLSEFRSNASEPMYVDAKGHWAETFVTDKPGVVQPGAGQLYRGFLMQLEVPGHFFPRLKDEAWARQVTQAGTSFVDTLSPADVPDVRPFISKLGFAGTDKKMTFHSYEDIFTPEGQLTPLGREIESRMVQLPPPGTARPGTAG